MKLWCSLLMALVVPMSVMASVTRSVISESDREVCVRLSWMFDAEPESAFVLTEVVPEGWHAELSGESEGVVTQVRRQAGQISFLLDPVDCGASGSLTYTLGTDAEETRAVLVGSVMLSESSQVVTYGIMGDGVCSTLAGMSATSEALEGEGVEPKKFRITSFEVSRGDDPRVTIAWEGAPANQEVRVEWMSLEKLSEASTKSSKRMRAMGEVDDEGTKPEWELFWTVPAEGRQRVRAQGAVVEPGTGSVTPDVVAPQGLYRLRVIEK